MKFEDLDLVLGWDPETDTWDAMAFDYPDVVTHGKTTEEAEIALRQTLSLAVPFDNTIERITS